MSDNFHVCDFAELVGKRILHINGLEKQSERVTFLTAANIYQMRHSQDCCESVYVEDIVGDVEDIMCSPIISAEEVTNHEEDNPKYDSVTWTFYKIDTAKGGITIRWCGESSGYYSESVDFEKKDFL